jgi:hypothetical protein
MSQRQARLIPEKPASKEGKGPLSVAFRCDRAWSNEGKDSEFQNLSEKFRQPGSVTGLLYWTGAWIAITIMGFEIFCSVLLFRFDGRD